MAERIINPAVRLLSPNVPVDDAAGDPQSVESQEATAQLAALSGVALNERGVSTFINEISNSAFAATIQGAQR